MAITGDNRCLSKAIAIYVDHLTFRIDMWVSGVLETVSTEGSVYPAHCSIPG